MVLTINAFSVIVFLAVVAGIFFLRWEIRYWYKLATKDLVNVVRSLAEKEHQQQVIYNISTSIFLLHSTGEIIKSTISEIVIMYHWSNVAFFPYGQRELNKDFYGTVPKFSPSEAFEYWDKSQVILNSERLGEYTSTFPVGRIQKPFGFLYVAKTGNPLTDDQAAFFKTVASFLTLALDNIALKS